MIYHADNIKLRTGFVKLKGQKTCNKFVKIKKTLSGISRNTGQRQDNKNFYLAFAKSPLIVIPPSAAMTVPFI